MIQLCSLLLPNEAVMTMGVVADLAVGDPVYAWHPVRLVGTMLAWMEERLREAGFDGYGVVFSFSSRLRRSRSAPSRRCLWWQVQARCLWRGWPTHFFSTACSRSAICCITSGGLRLRSVLAICLAPVAG